MCCRGVKCECVIYAVLDLIESYESCGLSRKCIGCVCVCFGGLVIYSRSVIRFGRRIIYVFRSIVEKCECLL